MYFCSANENSSKLSHSCTSEQTLFWSWMNLYYWANQVNYSFATVTCHLSADYIVTYGGCNGTHLGFEVTVWYVFGTEWEKKQTMLFFWFFLLNVIFKWKKKKSVNVTATGSNILQFILYTVVGGRNLKCLLFISIC